MVQPKVRFKVDQANRRRTCLRAEYRAILYGLTATLFAVGRERPLPERKLCPTSICSACAPGTGSKQRQIRIREVDIGSPVVKAETVTSPLLCKTAQRR